MATKKFKGNYKNLAKIGEFVETCATKAGLSDQDIYNVQLAVDEAATNIIEHAYGGENIGDITCTCFDKSNSFEVVLVDTGGKFNPDSVPSPDVGKDLFKYGPRGAGLYLMKNLLDDVKFEFRNEQTILRLIKMK